MAYPLRTRLANEIIVEFFPPARAVKRQRVVIVCDGMPTVPGKNGLLEFLSKKGFWVFEPRYRGSWESDGIFLRKSPEQDILDMINALPKGFVSMWDGKKYNVTPDEIFILANSFGGPAGILASRDPRIKKVVAVSPVVDWQAPSKTESLDWLELFVHKAFGQGYRFGSTEWAKLKTGKFYNPVRHVEEIDGSKLFIFHAKDDDVVRWNEVSKFARATGAEMRLFKKGGHLSMTKIVMRHWKQVGKFFEKK